MTTSFAKYNEENERLSIYVNKKIATAIREISKEKRRKISSVSEELFETSPMLQSYINCNL